MRVINGWRCVLGRENDEWPFGELVGSSVS
jgi:hypothetical protein